MTGAVVFALGVGGLGSGHVDLGLQHGDLFRPLADLQIGELRLRLRKAGFGLRHRDSGIGIFQRHHGRARRDAIAALDGDRIDLCHLDGREQHIVALDITDSQGRRGRTGTEELSGKRQRAEETHFFDPIREASMALRLSDTADTTLAASAAPMSCQPMRRITASRPMRK